MNDKDRTVLKKIKEYGESITEYTKDISSAAELQNDRKTMSASVFELMQIGELSKMDLSDETKQLLKQIPWKQIYGLRNRIVHGYGGINHEILLETIKNDIPKLCSAIEEFLNEKTTKLP